MKLIVVMLASAICLTTHAQKMSAANSAQWTQLKALSASFAEGKIPGEGQLSPFPVYKLSSGYFVSVFGTLVPGADLSQLAQQGILTGSVTGNIATLKVPLSVFHQVDFSGVFSYIELPAKAYPHLDRAVKDTRADSVQRGIGLPEAFTGKDVLIGITDWGFDYTHPMFYDTLYQQTRIHAAWDQYKLSGNTPSGFSYGAEYDSPAELLAAGSDTSNIYSYNTHGTHVAGITGGSGATLPYRGFAFESEFLFATFLIDAASVLDAFNWMKSKADASGKRLVVNMSWGLTYMGTLDGNSLLSQAISTLSDQGVVFVASAGNNGDANYHIKKVFNNDFFTSRITFDSYSNPAMWGQSVTMWGEEAKPFSAGIQVFNTSGTLLFESPAYNTASQEAYLDTIAVIGTDTVFYNLASENANPLNNRPNMRLRVKNTNTTYKIVLTSAAPTGTVHYWNVAELTTGVGNWGLAFASFGANPLSGNSQYSIGEPACAPDVITVAAYTSSYTNPQGNPAGGSLASFTSSGPLYTEALKPDIAAPGVNVISSISSFTDAAYTTAASTTFNGQQYDFSRFSGTSMSSPCVAGIVALIMDANPSLMPYQIKNILKSTARTDNNTGVIASPGHVRWGMGKVNAYASVILALNTLSVEELAADEWLILYPNPASETTTILLPENITAESGYLISSDGKRIGLSIENNQFQCSGIASGTYIAEITANNKVYRTSLVKQ